MKRNNFFTDENDNSIYYRVWPVDKPKALIQFAHGMAEHINRYDEFANWLNKKGFLVYGNNHRGHGPYSNETLGYFNDEDGWKLVLEDMESLNNLMSEKYPNTPKFLLGHSMGSFLTRYFMANYAEGFNGFILTGSGYKAGFMEKLFLVLTKLNKSIYGPIHKSNFLNDLFNNTLSFKLKDKKTKYDWINTSDKEVEIYIEDPYCGFQVTNQFFIDLTEALIHINDEELLERFLDIPILILGGDNDPVGNNGKDLIKLDELYKDHGFDSTLIIYKNMRHEILREKERFKVYEDIARFINGNRREILHIDLKSLS